MSQSATDPDLSDRKAYHSSYRTISSDKKAALALVKLILRFNWSSCAIIYQNDVFGAGAF
ncbi:unnamed protein product, partial [Rotaria magnacalcarata]